MTPHDDPSTLVRRMQECFNARQFDDADVLFRPDFVSHPLGTTGFARGKQVWRDLVGRFPNMRLVAEDILVDGDKVAIRSAVTGIFAPTDDAEPMLFEFFRVEHGRLAEMWGASKDMPGTG